MQTLSAQEFATRLYTPQQDGLVHSQVGCVKQAPDGRIWVGTQGGVSCFDGLEFINYSEADGLSANLIYDIQAWNDTVFVVTRDGVDLIVDGKVINYFYDDNVKFINGRLKMNQDHQFILAHDFNKAFVFNIRKKTFWLLPERFPATLYLVGALTDSSVLLGKDNVLYELSYADSIPVPVFEFETEIGRIETYKNLVFVNCTHANSSGGFNSISHKLIKTGGKFTKLPFYVNDRIALEKNEFIDRWFYSREGKTFLFSNSGKMFFLEAERIIKYAENYHYVNGAIEDRNGNIWMATEKGLLKIFMDKFQYYSPEQGYPENVWTAAGINDSLVLMASYNNRIHVYNNGEHIKINDAGSHYIACYLGACFGFQNDLLICTFPGIARYDIVNNSLSIIADKMNAPSLTLYKDELNKRVLVGNLRTLVSVNEDYTTDSLFDITTLGNLTTIISITVRENKILMGLARGLAEFDPETEKARYLVDEKTRFNSIVVDDRNAIWAATTKGLMHILDDSSRFVQGIEKPLELNSLILYSDSLLFAAGQTSLYLVNLNSFYQNKAEYLKSYGIYDGYLGDGAQQNVFFKDPDGNLWLPTTNKVVKMFPEDFKDDDQVLKPKIVELSVSDGDTVYSSLNLKRRIEFPFSKNSVRLGFVAVNQLNPELTEYFCVLDNGTKKWSSISKERKVSFNNLPPGNYKFTVKASTGNAFENVPGSVIHFTITPPFWQRWWFLTLILLSLIGFVVFIVIRVKRKEQKKHKVKIELSRLKNVALSLQIDHHFLANCTSKIIVLNESGKIEEANKYTRYFANFLRTNLIFLRSEKISLEDELQLIKQYVNLEKLYGKDFKFELIVDKAIDAKKVFLFPFLIQPLIENAIRHGAKQLKEGLGKVSLNVKMLKDKIKISIEDNGPGLQKSNIPKKEGNSMSLLIVQERLDLMGKGSTFYFDKREKGTRVILEIPIT